MTLPLAAHAQRGVTKGHGVGMVWEFPLLSSQVVHCRMEIVGLL